MRRTENFDLLTPVSGLKLAVSISANVAAGEPHKAAKPGGYSLAPAFDLLPDITGRAQHTLSFRSSFACPNYADLMTIADEWKVKEARRVISQVTKAVRTFDTTARKLAVRGGESLENISADIRGRLKAIGN
jgi:hypothetical protein